MLANSDTNDAQIQEASCRRSPDRTFVTVLENMLSDDVMQALFKKAMQVQEPIRRAPQACKSCHRPPPQPFIRKSTNQGSLAADGLDLQDTNN
mmetsp:Transcript_31820/g.84979  ORF Transcript_31820/g.84979 Transcript_31820/m.84979 type:complete len:93 (+) Transcript_31820:92-370(+)